MGQKVSPTGFRLGITEEWRSRWYADKDYAKNLANDLAIRKFLDKQLARAAVSKIEIERAGDKIKIIVTTARPGVVIGKKGAEIDSLRKKLEKVANGPVSDVYKRQALRHVEGVEAVMPARETDVMASSDGEQYATRVHSLPDAARTSDTSDGVHARSDDPDYLNRPLLVRGSWPQKTGECVL